MSVCFILHAHIPSLHGVDDQAPSMRWLRHAVLDSYLPLLRMLDDVPGDAENLLTFAVSMPLIDALDDAGFQKGFQEWLEHRLTSARERVKDVAEPLSSTAEFYADRLEALRADFVDHWSGDISGALAELADERRIELVPSVSSQPILPLLATPSLRRAHIESSLRGFETRFGIRPQGIWLPSCAVDGSVDECLGEFGLQWAVTNSVSTDSLPYRSTSGLTWFVRNLNAASMLVGADTPLLCRDVALDTDLADPERLLSLPTDDQASLLRTAGPFHGAPQYEALSAREQAQTLGRTFGAAIGDREGVHICALPAEVFGRVWFEGPSFLGGVLSVLDDDDSTLRCSTPTAMLPECADARTDHPTASSWGTAGYFRDWLGASSRWIHRSTRRLERRLVDFAARHAVADDGGSVDRRDQNGPAADLSGEARAATEALRHLMLAQSSDWHLMIRSGFHADFALEAVQRHLRRSTEILDDLDRGVVPSLGQDAKRPLGDLDLGWLRR